VQQFRIVGLVSIAVILHWFSWLYSPFNSTLSGEGGTPSKLKFTYVHVGINDDAVLSWTTINERDPRPFYVEQFAYSKWMRVGMIYGDGGRDSTHYEYRCRALLNSGNNTFRVRRETDSYVDACSSQVHLKTKFTRVYHFLDKAHDRILLSRRGHYYIYDELGMLARSGYGSVISLQGILKGEYFLCYDNRAEQLKL
jgi:hypothetical protein